MRTVIRGLIIAPWVYAGLVLWVIAQPDAARREDDTPIPPPVATRIAARYQRENPTSRVRCEIIHIPTTPITTQIICCTHGRSGIACMN